MTRLRYKSVVESPPIQPVRYAIEEYLRIEAASSVRHEYRDGQIIAMSGGSPTHSLIIANSIREVGVALKGNPCRVYDSNLRIRIPRTPLYTYPDLSIICGAVEFDSQDSNRTTAINPRVIIEVLSPSTESDDRGEKLRRYLPLPSLQEYVLISQIRPRIEAFARHDDGSWRFAFSAGLEGTLKLGSLGIAASLSEVYAGVEFPPDPDAGQLP
jgi:Uma2 family endonuclease